MKIGHVIKVTLQRVLSHWIAGYLKFVWSTSTIIYYPNEQTLRGMPTSIFAGWHGHHFMGPFVRPRSQNWVVPVAHGEFGSVYTGAFAAMGLTVIRGSAGKDFHQAGGFRSLREMLRALKMGSSVALTIDIQPCARMVGDGVLALAQHSGRPIVPLAIVSNLRTAFAWRWDRAVIALPFGRLVVACGNPIAVSNSKDKQYLEAKREELRTALEFLHLHAETIANH